MTQDTAHPLERGSTRFDGWGLAALGLSKLAVSLAVLAGGFVAISDDDFARVVIAQKFALAPSMDPSGTSWLPIPFWVYGAGLMAFGRSIEVARGVAVVLGVGAVLLVAWAAQTWGLSRRAARLAAAVAALFPYSAWLGVAPVPELPAAACTLLALACVSRSSPSGDDSVEPSSLRTAIASGAITVAAGSRYEAWPIAFGIAAFGLADALRSKAALGRRALRAALALGALSFPLAWLAHGHFVHGDTFFFVRRVVDYKQALGAGSASLTESLVSYPVAFLRSEPELLALTVASTALAWAAASERIRTLGASFARPALLLALQLAVLIAGDVRGGGPTHHPERALVTGYLFAAVLSGIALDALLSAAPPRLSRLPRALRSRRVLLPALGAGLAVLLFAVHETVRPPDLHLAAFRLREDELAAGRLARQEATTETRLLVGTDDYGYFAVLAAFGAPERASVLDDHDPRSPSPPSTSPKDLERLLQAAQPGRQPTSAELVLLPRAWLLDSSGDLADPPWGTRLRGSERFVLLRLGSSTENSPLRPALH